MSEATKIDGHRILAWQKSRWGFPPRWRILRWNDGINKAGYTWPCWMCDVCTLSEDESAFVGWVPLPDAVEIVPERRRVPKPLRRRLTSMQRKGGERVRAKFAGRMVRIWSGEHCAWWRSERAGYTTHEAAAGVYTMAEAWDATHHCGLEKAIVFEAVP